MFRKVERLHGANPVVPLGFVENVADLMVASDVLLTKTGGVTLAEAFCCGLPVLAFDPLPGQEEGNARLIVESNSGAVAQSPSEVAERVRSAFANDLDDSTLKFETCNNPIPFSAKRMDDFSVPPTDQFFGHNRTLLCG